MTVLTSARLLDAWEWARLQPPASRPLVLLAAAGRGGPGDLADLPIGVRDGYLLDLLEAMSGPYLEAVVSCPACRERLELSCTVAQLRAGPGSAEETVCAGGYELTVRPPTGADLAAAASSGEPEHAHSEFLRRCVGIVSGPESEPQRLPEPVVAAVEQAMLAADPQAEILVALTCAACGEQWQADLDVAAFAWAQVDASARRCAAEVHALALAYGWSEAETLAMSPWRRDLYLQMVEP
jgi:hypothetical protein